MTSADPTRRRGSIRVRGGSPQVRVTSGADPVTGQRAVLTATVPGTDRAARRAAEKKLIDLQHQVDQQRVAASAVSLKDVMAEWLRTSEIEESTRKTYAGYITRTIEPALGQLPVRKIDARTLENLYADLRRCRIRCNARPSARRATTRTQNGTATDVPHTCRPLAVSTVQQMHWVISGSLEAATRWGWINGVTRAFEMNADWGTLVWLAMATGMRRGELCACASLASTSTRR